MTYGKWRAIVLVMILAVLAISCQAWASEVASQVDRLTQENGTLRQHIVQMHQSGCTDDEVGHEH